MAVVTTKSTVINARDTSPKVLIDSFIAGGQVSEAYGFVSAASGDSIASAYKLCKVPSNARISSLRVAGAALGAGVTLSVGVFYPTMVPAGGGAFIQPSLGGTLITSTAIATGQSMASAVAQFSDLLTTATVSLDKQEMCLWQMIGMAADPQCDLDLGFVVAGAAVSTTGLVAMKVTYIW